MKTFKTSKAEILFVVLPKDAYDVRCLPLMNVLSFGSFTIKSISLPHGNWQLIGKLSEIKEDVARELVDRCNCNGPCIDYKDYSKHSSCDTATESLNSLATHLDFNLNDNIYILTKKL